MTLTLHYHPLSSYCWKALIALHENDTPFTPNLVSLGDESEADALRKLWPPGQFPVLEDTARGKTLPESSIIIEYLDANYPGRTRFLPADSNAALEVRLRDRFFDLHMQAPMQAFNANILRPADKKDAFGAEQSRAKLKLAKQMVEDLMASRTWAAGEDFSMADCAAVPALYYANIIEPLGPSGRRYLERLSARPSIARVLREAEPFFQYVPREA